VSLFAVCGYSIFHISLYAGLCELSAFHKGKLNFPHIYIFHARSRPVVLNLYSATTLLIQFPMLWWPSTVKLFLSIGVSNFTIGSQYSYQSLCKYLTCGKTFTTTCYTVDTLEYKQKRHFFNGLGWPLAKRHSTLDGIVTHRLRTAVLDKPHTRRVLYDEDLGFAATISFSLWFIQCC